MHSPTKTNIRSFPSWAEIDIEPEAARVAPERMIRCPDVTVQSPFNTLSSSLDGVRSPRSGSPRTLRSPMMNPG